MTNKTSILFRSLLPELASDGVVFSWQESQLRDLDWSEKDVYGLVPFFDLKNILTQKIKEQLLSLSIFPCYLKECE